MKRFAFKFISVIAAFLIGVSINNSCGESPMDEDSSIYNSIRALQNKNTLTDCIFGMVLQRDL